MREDASEFEMLALGELASEAIRICGLDAQAIHAGIDLQMNRGVFLAEFGGGCFVGEKLLATMNSWSEIVLDEGFFFAVPETTEHEDGCAHADFADINAFAGRGDAEPVGAKSFESFCDLRATVTVAIAFHDRKDFARRAAFFRWRIDVIADGVEILPQRGETYFCPNRTADK